MASGGVRQGTPGKAYTNRSDLNVSRQPAQAPTGQPYGANKAAMDAQRTIPLPQQAHVIPLDAPTQRPDEPVTAGLPSGPGPGPEALMPTGALASAPDADMNAQIRALYRAFPNSDLLRLVEALDQRGV